MAGWDRDTPWRQGHVLSAEAVKALNLSGTASSQACLALVISHDCDLAASSDQEPVVELISGRRIAALDGNHTHAKNARRLHLAFRDGEKSIAGEFLATRKVVVSKSDLSAFQPNSEFTLPAQDKAVLQRWLSARYRRSAFPDEFERRLDRSGLKTRLTKILKPSGSYIRAIFFDVDRGEEIVREAADDVYLLDIVLLHTTDDSDNAFKAASATAAEIKAAFESRLYRKDKGWELIELRDCMAISDEALTVKQSTFYKEWRLEHLSLRESPPQPMLPK